MSLFFSRIFCTSQYRCKGDFKDVFLVFGNANIKFANQELIWRSYSAIKAQPITKKVKINNKNKFAKTALNEDCDNFIIQIAALRVLKMTNHSSKII